MIPMATTSIIADAVVTSVISQAEAIIKTDFSGLINFTTVDALATTPYFINLLSRYKTCEKGLVRIYGFKRTTQQITDIDYWKKEYDDLKDAINSGSISIVDISGNSLTSSTATFSNVAKSTSYPAFGVDDRGEFVKKADIADLDNREME
jgi:hypothetical protein